jgi:hypothetical protein
MDGIKKNNFHEGKIGFFVLEQGTKSKDLIECISSTCPMNDLSLWKNEMGLKTSLFRENKVQGAKT